MYINTEVFCLAISIQMYLYVKVLYFSVMYILTVESK